VLLVLIAAAVSSLSPLLYSTYTVLYCSVLHLISPLRLLCRVQFKGPTPVPLAAFPGYATTNTGSIQVGYTDGTGTDDSPNIVQYTNIVDRDAFAWKLAVVHGVDTVLTYPSLL